MPLHVIPIDDLRNACRRRIETLETWLRRLIDFKLTEAYGLDYINYLDDDGKFIFNKDIRDHCESMFNGNAGRYSKKVDTLLYDQLIYFICRDDMYKVFFGEALRYAYPDGNNEARTFLDRITPIRNKLSHANEITQHEAERVICYTSDIISGLKQYYKDKNMEQDYNAPKFVAFRDNWGHSEVVSNTQEVISFARRGETLRVGDTIRCEFEVDSSFDSSSYEVQWAAFNWIGKAKDHGTGVVLEIILESYHVNKVLTYQAMIISKNEWHRHGHFDARLAVEYKVLPPL